MKILAISGSRADWGLLTWPMRLLGADPFFRFDMLRVWNQRFTESFVCVENHIAMHAPDIVLMLGDRFEILAAATAAHLNRVPIAHIAGGDVTEGSYDDAMRDAISRMASVHFVTSTSAMARLAHMGYSNVHLVGNPGIDYIRNWPWKKERPYADPYCVISYQAETIDGTNEIGRVIEELPDMRKVFILPNPDRGNGAIVRAIMAYCKDAKDATHTDYLEHAEFLNLIAHCECFIGNSSAMLYEAPELGVKTKMIGKRQRGRTIPWGDGHAAERMLKVLKYGAL